jgi:proline dehydrogenase
MLRRLLLFLSRAAWADWMVRHMPLAKQMAGRFVAGETADDAVAAIRALNAEKITATVDHLGEHVKTPDDVARSTEGYLLILDKVAKSGVEASISLKLTQLGLDLDEALCLDQMRKILVRASEHRIFIRIDMESSHYTDRTLAVCRRLHREFGPNCVGVVVQAYLYRSENDLRNLIADRIRVRLCKGAYREPPETAYPRKEDVDANYVRLTHLLLDNAADGVYHAVATHDEKMIQAAIEYAALRHVAPDQFEFQMLYGIRRDLQRRLVAKGHYVRVYVPYGSEWYPYLMRRLAERPANLWFFLSHLVRR